MNSFYMTGRTASRGGLRMGDLALFTTIHAALKSLEDLNGNVYRWSGRLFRILPDGSGPTKIDVQRIGFGNYYMDDKTAEKRKPVRISKTAVDETFELHERYSKHEYVPISPGNLIMYCPACGAFGLKATVGTKYRTLVLLPQDFTGPVILNLADLMSYLQPDMRAKLASYLKSVGMYKLSPEKLVALDAMVEGTYAELDNEHP